MKDVRSNSRRDKNLNTVAGNLRWQNVRSSRERKSSDERNRSKEVICISTRAKGVTNEFSEGLQNVVLELTFATQETPLMDRYASIFDNAHAIRVSNDPLNLPETF